MGSILWGWGRGHCLTISPKFEGFHCGGTNFITKNSQFLHIRIQIYFHNPFSSASTRVTTISRAESGSKNKNFLTIFNKNTKFWAKVSHWS
jgi:hypothetical protein